MAYRVPVLATCAANRSCARRTMRSTGTEIEALAIGNCFLRKTDQDPALKQKCEHKFELD